jgi:hypothetical protein
MEANRYKFTEKSIKKAIRVIKKQLDESKAPKWYKRYKADLKLDKKSLFLGDKQIVPKEKIGEIVRGLLYTKGSKVPWGRESGYNIVKNKYIGISKRDFYKIVQSQEIKVKSDPVPPVVKKAGARVNKRGMLECDLYHVSSNDLPEELARAMKGPVDLQNNKQAYVLTCVDKLSGLTFAHYLGASKGAKSKKRVMKVIQDKMLPFFVETLKIPKSRLFTSRDLGGEFAPPSQQFRGRHVKIGNHIEARNRRLQSIMHRLIKGKRGSLTSVVKQSQDIINNTKSYRGFTPLEAVEKTDAVLSEIYNSKRRKGGVEKQKDLKIGDRVRLVTKKQKGEAFYKSYQSSQWSTELYTISKVGRAANKRYYLAELKQWKHRHELSFPQPEPDKETKKLLDARTQYGNPKAPKLKGPRPKKKPPQGESIGARLKREKAEKKAEKKFLKALSLGERLKYLKKKK